jgi:hypothetical protein
MLNAVTQGFKIQDANRTDWIFFQYNIDESSYLLGKGFNATYSIGMEHNTIIFYSVYSLVSLFAVPQNCLDDRT